MKYLVKWLLKEDLFLHRELLFDKWDDFYSFITYWNKRSSDFKCMHIYYINSDTYDFCDEESSNV